MKKPNLNSGTSNVVPKASTSNPSHEATSTPCRLQVNIWMLELNVRRSPKPTSDEQKTGMLYALVNRSLPKDGRTCSFYLYHTWKHKQMHHCTELPPLQSVTRMIFFISIWFIYQSSFTNEILPLSRHGRSQRNRLHYAQNGFQPLRCYEMQQTLQFQSRDPHQNSPESVAQKSFL